MDNKQPIKRKYVLYFWLAMLAGPVLIMLHLLLISVGLYGALPSLEELENPKSNQASEVLSADGKLLGTYFAENRSNVKAAQLSPHLINALISTEDERFRSHSGIDIKSLMRAVVFMGKRGGGSTITQQLAKNCIQYAWTIGWWDTGAKTRRMDSFTSLRTQIHEGRNYCDVPQYGRFH
jgi:penicillin-binding protein 1A